MSNNIELEYKNGKFCEAAKTATALNCGDTLGEEHDDRRDPEHEPARITSEEWNKNNFYAVTITADPGDAADDKQRKMTVKGYEDYISAREYLHENGYFITGEDFQTKAEYFPGLLTYEDAVNEFVTVDDRYIELKNFPEFSQKAKIHVHDSVVIAADTGEGKSSLALNFINDLNDDYPILYINLEMDSITILRRLVAIHTGLELDYIESYKNEGNEDVRKRVNAALKSITSRKPLQILKDVYNLEDTRRSGKILPGIETIIKKSIEDREDPTIVIIDHSLLVKTADKKINGRYERFTHVSEELRKISLNNNIILFILLQQNREGKKTGTTEEGKNKRPTNDSLKESGSWENDATQIVFLWREDPDDKTHKKLSITKNRDGYVGDFDINYEPRKQIYSEFRKATAEEEKIFKKGGTVFLN